MADAKQKPAKKPKPAAKAKAPAKASRTSSGGIAAPSATKTSSGATKAVTAPKTSSGTTKAVTSSKTSSGTTKAVTASKTSSGATKAVAALKTSSGTTKAPSKAAKDAPKARAKAAVPNETSVATARSSASTTRPSRAARVASEPRLDPAAKARSGAKRPLRSKEDARTGESARELPDDRQESLFASVDVRNEVARQPEVTSETMDVRVDAARVVAEPVDDAPAPALAPLVEVEEVEDAQATPTVMPDEIVVVAPLEPVAQDAARVSLGATTSGAEVASESTTQASWTKEPKGPANVGPEGPRAPNGATQRTLETHPPRTLLDAIRTVVERFAPRAAERLRFTTATEGRRGRVPFPYRGGARTGRGGARGLLEGAGERVLDFTVRLGEQLPLEAIERFLRDAVKRAGSGDDASRRSR